MNETKSVWASKTVWGGIVAFVASIAGIWGYAIAPEEQAVIVDAACSVAAGMGAAVAILGRVTASKRVK